MFQTEGIRANFPGTEKTHHKQHRNDSTLLQGGNLREMRQVDKGHFLHMKLYPNSKDESFRLFKKMPFSSDFTYHKLYNVE